MSQIDVTIGNDLVTTLTNLDNYKAYFQLLTNYSLNSLFQSALFNKDTAGNMDSLKFEPGASNVDVPKFNTGLYARRVLMGASKAITLIGR